MSDGKSNVTVLRGGRRKDAGENLAERIYARLKQEIFDFQLLPGDRFSENEVADRMAAINVWKKAMLCHESSTWPRISSALTR